MQIARAGRAKKFAGRVGGKGDFGIKEPLQPKIIAPKEESPIDRVPLLQYGCTMDEFMIFENHLLAHVESGGFPLDGRCLSLDHYTDAAPITEERIDEEMMAYDGLRLAPEARELQRAEVIKNLGKEFMRERRDRRNEKMKLHGFLCSVISMRSRSEIEATNQGVFADQEHPLALWREIKRTHKTGTHHLTDVDAVLRLQAAFTNAKQKPSESLADYSKRFNRIVDALRQQVGRELIPDAATCAVQWSHGVNRDRNPIFAEEFDKFKIALRRLCRGRCETRCSSPRCAE